MKYLKLACALVCLAIVASNIWTMRNWSERRGVADDLCYLRQAHLFQKHGFGGLNTDVAADTDGYFTRLVTEAGHPEWTQPDSWTCHVRMADDKRVLQYPPGPGFLLALFPEGHQVVPFYAAATLLILLAALVAIGCAQSTPAILAAGAFGCMALYFMINPAKSSYSIPPTLAICAAVGYLTARLFDTGERRPRLIITAAIGLLLGLSVNFRLPNLLLASGYFTWFAIAFLIARDRRSLIAGVAFGLCYVLAMTPTLLANAINAGSALRTTYGGADVAPPDLSFSISGSYLRDLQGILIVVALAWVIALLLRYRTPSLLPVGVITAVNLAVNLGYFLSHPIFTQYYLMPIAMLSLWTLLFALLYWDAARASAGFSRPAVSAMP